MVGGRGSVEWTSEDIAIMTDVAGACTATCARMDASKDDKHSDDSQETTFSSASNAASEQDESDAQTVAETQAHKRRYPYWQLFFIMAATTGER